jgi:hypothetical protein
MRLAPSASGDWRSLLIPFFHARLSNLIYAAATDECFQRWTFEWTRPCDVAAERIKPANAKLSRPQLVAHTLREYEEAFSGFTRTKEGVSFKLF